MRSVWYDLRIAARSLRRSPAFTAAAALTLALGIGANAAIFSVFNGLILKPLAYPNPDRLVRVSESNPRRGWIGVGVTGPMFAAWRADNRSFEYLVAVRPNNSTLTGLNEPVEITIGGVSAGFFDALGERTLFGRSFEGADHEGGAQPVVILSRGIWVARFGADSSIIGRAITIDDLSRTVIGIMPDRGEATDGLDAWVPVPDVFHQLGAGNHMLSVLGRLRPNVTLAAAAGELEVRTVAALENAPENDRGWIPELVPLAQSVVGPVANTVVLLLGAVGFVLLIACANVANLTLVRAHGRRREVALRAALGADRGQLLRGLLTESGLLAAIGAVGGLLIAVWGTDAILGLSPANFPRRSAVTVDATVLAFTALVTVLAAILFGMVPALGASRIDLQKTLREGGGAGRRGVGRDVLAVLEIALALMLTAGAGLLVQTLVRLERIDLGYDAAGALALDLDLPSQRYREPAARTRFVQDVEARIRAIPGVRAVGSTRALPLESGGPDTEFDIAGRAGAASDARGWAFYTAVTPSYHAAIGSKLVAGRYLTDADDRPGAPAVIVVNETLARKYWPSSSPVGARIRFGNDVAEIVGVIADLRQKFLADDVRPALFVPFSRAPETQVSTVVRAAGDPLGLVPALRKAVWTVDPELPVEQWTMTDLMRTATARPRFNAILLGGFAGLAVLLAVIGVYGVVSFGVALRRREIGVRLALGARPRDVLGLVLRRGGTLAGIGVGLGVLGAALVTRLLSKLLYGVRPTDLGTLTAAATALVLITVGACLVPARRAAGVAPTETLRGD